MKPTTELTTEPARLEDPKKEQQLSLLIEQWNTKRQTWVLQAISNCVLGEAEGFQKNVYRHLIKRVLDPLRVEPGVQIVSLLMLGAWKAGRLKVPKEVRKNKGRAFWTMEFPFFNLVGRGNRPRTVLNKAWKTTRTVKKKKT